MTMVLYVVGNKGCGTRFRSLVVIHCTREKSGMEPDQLSGKLVSMAATNPLLPPDVTLVHFTV